MAAFKRMREPEIPLDAIALRGISAMSTSANLFPSSRDHAKARTNSFAAEAVDRS